MSWKDRWPERTPRMKVRPLSDQGREQTLDVFKADLVASPVLSSLDIRARSLRGRFYFERVWPVPGNKPEVEAVGRATPLENSAGDLVLEVKKRQGNWHEITRGTAAQIIDCIASDTKGTFHGLGALDKSLREMGGLLKRVEVKMLDGCRFVYASTDANCPFHEALFHFFGMPIDIIAEPRVWYAYHRRPQMLEVSRDYTQVLVTFTADGLYGSFSGVCLYTVVDNRWKAFTIKPNQSGDIATARAWLEKRGWQAW